jgi:hypothetical protein
LFQLLIYFVCRKEHRANEKHHVTSFGSGTGGTNIKKHFYTEHIADWVQGCEDKGCKITGAPAQHAVRRFKKLPEPTDLEAERTQFSKEAFVDALAEFVVGDDQVREEISLKNGKTHPFYQSLNVVESPRLKKIFLMLKKDLREQDIPGHTTIRVRIDKLAEDHLKELEEEMKVSSLLAVVVWVSAEVLIHYVAISWKNLIYN